MSDRLCVKSAYIEITNKCNLNCIDCYNSSGLNKRRIEIAPESFEQFIVELQSKYGVQSINISGGEPLLHSKWDQMLDIMFKHEDSFDFHIISNGTIYDERLYEAVSESRKQAFYLQISLDGCDEAVYSLMRGEGHFALVMDNLRRLHPAHPAGDLACVCKMVVTRTNMHQVEQYYRMIRSMQLVPAFAFANRKGNAAENWNDMCLTAQEKSSILTKIKRLMDDEGIVIALPTPTWRCPIFDEKSEDRRLGICVRADGALFPCQNLYGDEYTLMNINRLDWAEFEEKFALLCQVLQKRLQKDYGCGKCINKAHCGKGCPAAAANLGGTLLEADGDCDLRRLTAIKSALKYIKGVELR